ncbi:MAG: hypothetical protein KJO07_15060 [Deltaproteobacteria bacterium]|nr:hypothetical protein [Deltaproteobacteria bacterium]
MAIDPVSIAIGVAAGGVLGAVVGASMSKGKAAELENKLGKLEKERDKVKKQLKSGEDELDKAKQRAEELAGALDDSKKNLKDLESAKKKHLEDAKRLETKAKDLEKHAKAAEKHAKALEGKAKEAEKEAHDAAEDAKEKAALAVKLQEDLKKAGGSSSADYKGVENDLNGILKVLCEHEKQEAAVVSDANGIVVAAYGDGGVKEGMAAAANRITKIGDQLKGMVDFKQVSTFRISDSSNNVIAGRTFDAAGEMLALATVGAQTPSDGSLDNAMKHLHSMLA